MSLNSACCRVEIFSKPALFDDHFCANWAVNRGVLERDGDCAKLKINVDYAEIERTVSIDGGANQFLYLRITDLTSAYGLDLQIHSSIGGWHVDNYTTIGLKLKSLAGYGTIDKIVLKVAGGSVGQYAEVDYIIISDVAVVVPDPGDLVEESTIILPVLAKGINGATLTLQNFGGAYNGKVENNDAILFWLARDESNLGVPAYKLFGGKVVSASNRGGPYGAFYIDLECHGHAYELDIPPSLVQKIYSSTNGRTIIEDTLALCSYLTKHPTASMWFDNAGSSGSTDDRINSTHDVVCDEELPMSAIQEILEKAKNPSALQGFDAYEMSSGVLVGHLKNSLDFTSPIASINPENYNKSVDSHRIRNKIRVYGALAKMLGDLAESTTNWASDGQLYLGSTDGMEGAHYVWAAKFTTQTVYLRYDFSPAISCKFGNQYRKLHLWIRVMAEVFDAAAAFEVQLRTNGSNYYKKVIQIPHDNKWMELELDLGPDSEWSTVGSPDWENIGDLKVVFSNATTTTDVTLSVDGARFIKRFGYTASDSASQSLYGVRMDKPIIDDALTSDDECQARAESILAFLKDPVMALSGVKVNGDHRYKPGDRQRVIVSNDNLDAYFSIVEVRHQLKGTIWDTSLTLSNEPQYVDYVFKLLQEAQKLLERRS